LQGLLKNGKTEKDWSEPVATGLLPMYGKYTKSYINQQLNTAGG